MSETSKPQHVFAGAPDARQSDRVDMPTSRFRPVYRALTPEEKQLHDAIKAKAVELETLFNQVTTSNPTAGHEVALGMTKLEEAVIWSIKGLTKQPMQQDSPMPKDQPPHFNPFADQAAFMQACGMSTDTLNPALAALFVVLHEEETGELAEALFLPSPDLPERLARIATNIFDLTIEQRAHVAKEIADCMVVLAGLGIALGLPMEAVWNEVHRSNMAKIDPSTGKVIRRADGKILKPEGWTKPDIARVLREHAINRFPEEMA